MYELTDTQRDIQKAAREFAEKEFDLDLALELERDGRFPKSIFEKACQLGFIGIDYPEEYGGQSFGLFENILVSEEFCRKDSGIGIALSLSDIASSIILKHGDKNQKERFLIPLAQGKGISTVAILDPFHSKKVNAMLTNAGESLGKRIIVEGKALIINGSIADYVVIFCEIPDHPNSIAIVVERGQDGVNILGLKKMMGMRISSIHEIAFDKVKVPKDHVIQWGNAGTDPLTTYRHVHRIKTSAQALGIAQGAFDHAVKHAKEREQFGRKICQFQGIQFMLADLYTQIEAARTLVYRAAYQYDTNDPDIEKISSVAKLFATDVAVKVTIDSIQIHGGVGLMKEYSIERMLRDAKTIQNLGETNLVQKALIAKKIIS